MGILSLCFRVFPGGCGAPSTMARTYLLSPQTCMLTCDFGNRVLTRNQFATTEIYNYHSQLLLSVLEPEAPDQSLGDCFVCMEVHAEDPMPLQHVTLGELKNYSLAPCHRLFVRAPSISLPSTRTVWTSGLLSRSVFGSPSMNAG